VPEPTAAPATRAPRPLLDVTRIYAEPEAMTLPRGRQVLSRWPDATVVEVESHSRIPELYGDEANVDRWVRIKTEALVLGVKQSLTARPNGRSSDFIAPSTANGCAMACSYCYVPRRKGYSNPITVFANIDKITGYLERHVGRQGVKPEPNQNSDCSVDARISDNVQDLVTLFRRLPTAKASFATKHVNRDLLEWDPQGRTRVRFSLMPEAVSKVVDIRTSKVAERIAAIDDFVAAGYEVHVNLSPVIVKDGWLAEWDELLQQLDAGIGHEAKAQLAAEVIFLTHNDRLHQVNMGWHPAGEQLLWRPDLQQPKRSQTGGWNVRYRTGEKGRYVAALTGLMARRVPYCNVRYAF